MRVGYLLIAAVCGVVLAGCGRGEVPPETAVPESADATTTAAPAVTADPGAQAACPKHGGRWDAGQGCVIDEATPQATQHLVVPVQWDSSFPELQQAVDGTVADIRANFRKSVERAGAPPEGKPWALQVSFETYQGKGTHPSDSVRFSISESLGGYHPGFAFRTLAFDRTSRQAITLDTLLIDPATALPKISALVRTDLRAQLGGVGAEFVDTGTVPEPGNFKDFSLDGDALLFSFEPYRVAAYAEGPMQSRIALSELRDVVKPEYLPA
ncbi:putative secreted protein [Mycobacteroides abscessus subsp. massiliense]|uniref:RsiV family protein n=1 Tax=Mycobacteroides abscessus TaxID=36809 RepID=UPI0009A90FCE|nr:RsiV family protein [Mycobacteroides abscessus]SKQ93156.1 putative secreted protein [Mycobacteroides abscessus subsp. massiliense]SKR37097.1 putative secreted protein [Mycobacteroides abscessus subsp. massiliense]SKT84628.1 putative secreted protein [Mycobacteroides abscessus subsp. massiliense]SKU13445.1 putative secreted protein [Mycobacteroides abscessus subsp. massiliense]SLA36367.1 putative secreted protein [Mycobacteroides abscessus subsp. massiliense]